jgi:Uma2 family endonuclease
MSDVASHVMTIEEFLDWQDTQEHRCELVDGRPVAMTGARMVHDRVTVNILTSLSNRFRASGNPCEPFSGEVGVVINPRTLRRPDVSVYCPPFDALDYKSNRPRLVVEVLSRSMQHVHQFVKLVEYQGLPMIDAILLVSPDQVEVCIWSRGEGGAWQNVVLDDIEAVIDLPTLAVSLPLRDIYERVVLKPHARPRLVWPDPPV